MSTRSLAVQALAGILTAAKKDSRKPKEVIEVLAGHLDDRERSFLMEIVYGVLRYRDYLDWILGKFLDKPSSLAQDTINNLRMAVYQMEFMRVPDWAAVNESVDIEKNRKGRKGKAGLVNAVLRNYLRRGGNVGSPDKRDAVGFISVTTSHPSWLVRRWIARLGESEALKLAQLNNEVPALTIRIDGNRDDAIKRLAEEGISAKATRYSPAGISLKGIAPRQVPLDASSFIVQDEAAQLITYLLDPAPGERVLDACAAPGGKTTHIARLMNDQGEVVAVEIDPKRIGKVKENVARLGLRSVEVILGDIRKDAVSGKFDKVLLDAPCSSIGVIRRNPDVKYRHQEKDLAAFGSVQAGLLNRAASLLKPGGSMVYSVCSTEPEEGENVIKSFLQSHDDFSIIQGAYFFLERFGFRDEAGHLFYRTWPHMDGPDYAMDGFFAVRLERKK